MIHGKIMKTSLIIALFSFLLFSGPWLPSAEAQQVIAFWDFNNHPEAEDEDPQIIHNANSGSGVLYQQRADTDGNGKGGTQFTDALLGIDASDGRGIAWDDLGKSGDNDAEFFTVVSTLGFENIQVSFDFQGNANAGFTGFDAKYSLVDLIDVVVPDVDPAIEIKDFDGESIDLAVNQVVTNDADNFQRLTLNAPAAANDQAVFAFRLDDFEGNDAVRFDNVLITGTAIAVPEPSSLALLGVASIAMLRRRRQS